MTNPIASATNSKNTMIEIILLFPGQGSQYVGMGEKLIRSHPHTKQIFQLASDVLDLNLQSVMIEGPQENLQQTAIAQPAILSYSLALWTALANWLEEECSFNWSIRGVAGHSVGEYAALTVAGCLLPSEAIQAVHHRGLAMQEACPVGVGGMSAVIKAPIDLLLEGCKAVSRDNSTVSIANFNAPDQLVVSGHLSAIEQLKAWMEDKVKTHAESVANFRFVPLKVSAPFHSALMMPAASSMDQFLKESFQLQPNRLPYIPNTLAQWVELGDSPDEIHQRLVEQIPGCVLWHDSMKLIAREIEQEKLAQQNSLMSSDEEQLSRHIICLEVGPGKVLTQLMKKNFPDVPVFALEQCLGDDGLQLDQLEEFIKQSFTHLQ